jgi:hypothetical protein
MENRREELIAKGKSLRDLVERGAATHRRPPREVWKLAFRAILEKHIDAIVPDRAPVEQWEGVFAGALGLLVEQGDPSHVSWTREILLDPEQFNRLLKKRFDLAPGPKSKGGEMLEAYERLKQKGESFRFSKDAHAAVLNELGIDIKLCGEPRGYGIHSFRRCIRAYS